jgi:hypothetical protein
MGVNRIDFLGVETVEPARTMIRRNQDFRYPNRKGNEERENRGLTDVPLTLRERPVFHLASWA